MNILQNVFISACTIHCSFQLIKRVCHHLSFTCLIDMPLFFSLQYDINMTLGGLIGILVFESLLAIFIICYLLVVLPPSDSEVSMFYIHNKYFRCVTVLYGCIVVIF